MSFSFFFFFIYNIRMQEDRTGFAWGGLVSVGGGIIGKGGRMANITQIPCIHVCKWKSDAC
jgi:hypothetical protein